MSYEKTCVTFFVNLPFGWIFSCWVYVI